MGNYPDKKLHTIQLENGTWEARITIGGTPYLGDGDTESQAIDDVMIACGKFHDGNSVAADRDLWG